MNSSEFFAKLSKIPEVQPDEQDMEALARIQANTDAATITDEQLGQEIKYNGKISLRVPRSLHEELISQARDEGISLNQYILYKLAKN